MKSKWLLISLLAIGACSQKMNDKKLSLLSTPVAHRDTTKDNYFGTSIADPYRWLENDTAPEVIQWVVDQNKATNHYLDQIEIRKELRKRLTEIWNYAKYSAPFKEGDFYYFYKNDGLQNQSVLYRTKDLKNTNEAELFLDPNKFSDDGTVSLASLAFSKDHQFAAVGIARSGSDWNELFVMDVNTKNKTSDKIEWVKFSGASWFGNGFFYSRYDEPVEGKAFSNQNEYMKIYYHILGSNQKEDILIYEDKSHPLRYFNAGLTEDERFLFINISEGTSGSEILVKDNSPAIKFIAKENTNGFHLLCKGFNNNYSVVGNDGDQILVLTDLDAPKYKLVSIDPNNTSPQFWKTIIPEGKDLLEGVVTAGKGQLIASYLVDASTRLKHFTNKGELVKEIELPGIGTASTGGCKTDEHTIAYNYISFTEPSKIKFYDLNSQKQEDWMSNRTYAFNPDDFETKQVFYPSKDGTKIPMFVMHKKGLKLDGTNPTLLYGYGGFNISLTPSFSVSRILFMEQGGVYAIANLRGGGEYGEDWHKAGMLEKKQNVFDDFIAAAEYLVKEKYTSSEHLAIHGGSNGGLLVGACMTQRPELFKVAIPAVGVLDMLRYHKFTIGWGWAVEYGSSEQKDQFDYLIKYSPLHNVKAGVKYPATLIMTADHDDRVVPAHSFKFAATLQENPIPVDQPILIRIDSKAGHGAGKPTTKLIEDATDMYGFILFHTK
ncbi:MAG: prolyl oligopeptidase family serine peptidase [Bacteroidia bacterium]|nr:prolyl oligopeptidase family serine peptidase [Bacteroidia bacterium]MCF8425672.1 prolyl oligopeptidase family serine peptidase [Bacteroidia bacterium]MCF8447360.1 prolyl oligopeptidase family serine peptidase [Bacteroidia bacterium]